MFLLCVPRSGSSLTTFMLQNHSKIGAIQEMWFLMKLYDLRGRHRMVYGGTPILSRFFHHVISDETYFDACRAYALQIYNDLREVCGGKFIIDKSPRYYYLLEFLDRLFPESKRIWLVRNPLDIAASYKKLYQDQSFDLVQMMKADSFDMRMADLTLGVIRYMDYFAKENIHTIKVSYEELVREPREQLTRICQFLGLDYEEGMEQYGDFARSGESDLFFSMGVGDTLMLKHDVPHTQSVDQWDQILTAREVEVICKILGKNVFNRLGYADVISRAERLTNTTFSPDPDHEWLNHRIHQLHDLTGCKWENAYRMKEDPALNEAVEQVRFAGQVEDQVNDQIEGQVEGKDEDPSETGDRRVTEDRTGNDKEVEQLRMMLRILEDRLSYAYDERDRLAKKYERLRYKVDKVKSWIPFYSHIRKWTNVRLVEGRKRV